MKYAYYLLVLSLCFACSSSDDDPIGIEAEQIEIEEMDGDMEETEEEVSTPEPLVGVFVSDAHPTSGTVEVNIELTELVFTDFKTDDGPKLLVYLSTDATSVDYVDLGDLKGIEGNFTYEIPEGTDLEKYNVVSIWCVDFLVSFGHAELKME